FWIQGTARNRMLNQIEKIMSVAGSIPISDLRDGVGRHHRMQGFRPPRHVLAQLCVSAGYGYRDGKVFERKDLPPWSTVLSGIELTLARLLFEHGPVMRRSELEELAVGQEKVNRSSFWVY